MRVVGHVTPTATSMLAGAFGDRTEHRPHEGGVALLVEPRVEVVGDRHEVEAVALGLAGELDQTARGVLLAGQGQSELRRGHRPRRCPSWEQPCFRRRVRRWPVGASRSRRRDPPAACELRTLGDGDLDRPVSDSPTGAATAADEARVEQSRWSDEELGRVAPDRRRSRRCGIPPRGRSAHRRRCPSCSARPRSRRRPFRRRCSRGRGPPSHHGGCRGRRAIIDARRRACSARRSGM